jgi:hypothetical protein
MFKFYFTLKTLFFFIIFFYFLLILTLNYYYSYYTDKNTLKNTNNNDLINEIDCNLSNSQNQQTCLHKNNETYLPYYSFLMNKFDVSIYLNFYFIFLVYNYLKLNFR